MKSYLLTLITIAAAGLCSCSSQVTPKDTHLTHHFAHGKTAYLAPNGQAVAPPNAPARVKRMVAAANQIAHLPYRRGGGHAKFVDNGYDCSGATSYVLHAGGLLSRPLVSGNFMEYGEKGYGKWVNIYASNGHVFLEIAGLRFDTGGTWDSTGPRWKAQRRNVKKFVVRHPKGL